MITLHNLESMHVHLTNYTQASSWDINKALWPKIILDSNFVHLLVVHYALEKLKYTIAGPVTIHRLQYPWTTY